MEEAPINKEVLKAELWGVYKSALEAEMHGDDTKSKKIVAFYNSLRDKYQDYREYELYHLPVGSNDHSGKVYDRFDFPGEDSIEAFLRSL